MPLVAAYICNECISLVPASGSQTVHCRTQGVMANSKGCHRTSPVTFPALLDATILAWPDSHKISCDLVQNLSRVLVAILSSHNRALWKKDIVEEWHCDHGMFDLISALKYAGMQYMFWASKHSYGGICAFYALHMHFLCTLFFIEQFRNSMGWILRSMSGKKLAQANFPTPSYHNYVIAECIELHFIIDSPSPLLY